jgi:hypothetical protein
MVRRLMYNIRSHTDTCVGACRYVAQLKQQLSQTLAILARTEALLRKKENELQVVETEGLQRQAEVAALRAEGDRVGMQVDETTSKLRKSGEELRLAVGENMALRRELDEAELRCSAAEAKVLESAGETEALRETVSKSVELSAMLERHLAASRAEADSHLQELSLTIKRLEEESAARLKAWDQERDGAREREAQISAEVLKLTATLERMREEESQKEAARERERVREREAVLSMTSRLEEKDRECQRTVAGEHERREREKSAEVLKLTATLERMREEESQKDAARERERVREREAVLSMTSRLEEKDRECQRTVAGEHERREREKRECERELARTREELAEAVERARLAEARVREAETERDRLSRAMQETEKTRRERDQERERESQEVAAAREHARGREQARDEELETVRAELKTRVSRLRVLEEGKLESEQRILGIQQQLLQAQYDVEKATRQVDIAQHAQAKLQEELGYRDGMHKAQLATARAEAAESKSLLEAERQRLTQEFQILKDQLTGTAHPLRESVDKMASEMVLLERERAAQALQVEMAKMREQELRDQREKERVERDKERVHDSEAREKERLEWERERVEFEAQGAEALERIGSLESARRVLEHDLAAAVSKSEKMQAELAQTMQAHDAQLMQERQKASQAASCIEVVLASSCVKFSVCTASACTHMLGV